MNDQEYNLNVVKELGQFSLKALLTLNGGAIVVLLNFISVAINNNVNSDRIELIWLEWAIVWFLVGLALCFLAVVFGYILAFSMSEPKSALKQIPVLAKLFVQLVFPILSFAAFVVGVVFALVGFNPQ